MFIPCQYKLCLNIFSDNNRNINSQINDHICLPEAMLMCFCKDKHLALWLQLGQLLGWVCSLACNDSLMCSFGICPVSTGTKLIKQMVFVGTTSLESLKVYFHAILPPTSISYPLMHCYFRCTIHVVYHYDHHTRLVLKNQYICFCFYLFLIRYPLLSQKETLLFIFFIVVNYTYFSHL